MVPTFPRVGVAYHEASEIPSVCFASNLQHVSHASVSCFISKDIPGQKIHSLALLRVDSMPMCDECTFCFMDLLG